MGGPSDLVKYKFLPAAQHLLGKALYIHPQVVGLLQRNGSDPPLKGAHIYQRPLTLGKHPSTPYNYLTIPKVRKTKALLTQT